MRKLFLVVAVVGLLTGCSDDLEVRAKEFARQTDSINNPATVQFRNLRVGSDKKTLCGDIKQERVAGMMSSWQPFVGKGGRVHLLDRSYSADYSSMVWDMYCQGES